MLAQLQSLIFLNPLALATLLSLPVIWWLLRFTPPRPQSIRFPPLRILLGLASKQDTPDTTPWWLLALRLALATCLILAVAQPLLSSEKLLPGGQSNLVLVVDNGWAAARNWRAHETVMRNLLDGARTNNQTVALVTTTPSASPTEIVSLAAADALAKLATIAPKALDTDRMITLAALQQSPLTKTSAEIVWLSDGLDCGNATKFADGLLALNPGNSLTVFRPAASDLPLVLGPAKIDGGQLAIDAYRAPGLADGTIRVRAIAGNGRTLSEVEASFANGATKANAILGLPVELRNEIQRIEISDEADAAARFLFDDRWRRKTIAMMAGGSLEDAQPLLSPLHYVSRALEPFAEVSEPDDSADLKARLEAGLSMLVLADIGVLPPESQAAVSAWLDKGGLLLRFAGPRLTSSEDSLLPTPLRGGDRAFGSALSWEEPQGLQGFPEKSPFAGLAVDRSISIKRQILAEPDVDLADKVWASIDDGTPLVTAAARGKGQIILFHVTANADWSNLPLSGLFVDMLQRIVDLAPGAGQGAAGGTISETTNASYLPRRLLNGFGELVNPDADSRPIAAADFDKAKASPQTPAGLYARGKLERAINLLPPEGSLAPIASLPAATTEKTYVSPPQQSLTPYLFAAALLLFLADMIAALVLGGGWSRLRKATSLAAVALLVLAGPTALIDRAQAQSADAIAMQATLETRLAYVKTGDSEIDQISEQGLSGLGTILGDRTSVVLGRPLGVDIETDDIVFFPLLYWPVDVNAKPLTDAALAKMTTYMKNGGTIFFDLRDNGTSIEALSGNATPASQALNAMLAKIDIPPLEPASEEHVISRSFYLLKDFPGRYDTGRLWVERGDGEVASGNADGVSAIIIGANDYAAAWALDDSGDPVYALIPGLDRQREMAFRTGVNIVMYALTGNYKADQVHIPALLERLGQ